VLKDEDRTFQAANVYVYEYRSPLLHKTYSIGELAENLRLVLDIDRVFADHKEVVFLTHSMGGLVVRSLLSKYRELADKVAMIYFFATPTTGSAVAHVVRLVSQNPQLGQLIPMRSDDFLADLQRSWLAAKFPILSYCAYELRETFGFMVVEQASATNLCNMRLDPVDADHLNIVKPASARDVSYMAFRAAFEESRPKVAQLRLQRGESQVLARPGDPNEVAYRAWLTVKGLNEPFLAVPGGSAELNVVIENTGHSPAQRVQAALVTAVQLPNWTPPNPLPETPDKNLSVIGPRQTMTVSFLRTAPFTPDEINAINNGSVVLFFVATVTFDDQFSKSRGLKFCLRYEPPKDGKPVKYMLPCRGYDAVW